MHVLDDLNSTLGNLGGDVQGLEERSLLGAQPGVLGGNDDLQGSKSSGTSGSADPVVDQQVPDGGQVLLGEDESNVATDVGKDLLQGGVVLDVTPDGLAHHGVLAHEDNSAAPEGHTDLLHLLGSDIVSLDLKTTNNSRKFKNN